MPVRCTRVVSNSRQAQKVRGDKPVEHHLTHGVLDSAEALHLFGCQPQSGHFQIFNADSFDEVTDHSHRMSGSQRICGDSACDADTSCSVRGFPVRPCEGFKCDVMQTHKLSASRQFKRFRRQLAFCSIGEGRRDRPAVQLARDCRLAYTQSTSFPGRSKRVARHRFECHF